MSLPLISKWDSATDPWELYHAAEDFSQAENVDAQYPEKLEALKKEFLALAEDNKDLPIGAGNWLRMRPQDRIAPPIDHGPLPPTQGACPNSLHQGWGDRAML